MMDKRSISKKIAKKVGLGQVMTQEIVQMTLDNVGFDFLPGRWLVQIDTIETSMTMHQPYGDVWLTRDITAFAKVTTAYGNLAIRYSKTFYDYAVAETSATFRFPPRGEKKQEP